MKKKGKVLKRVKHKEQQDNEAGGHEMNPRINQLSVQLKVKKAHCAHACMHIYISQVPEPQKSRFLGME